MGGGIVQRARGIVGRGDDRPLAHDHRADRHFACKRCPARLVERALHRRGKWPTGHQPRASRGGTRVQRA